MNRKALIVMGLVAASWLIVGYAFATISRAHILGELTAERQSSDALRQQRDRDMAALELVGDICPWFENISGQVLNAELEVEYDPKKKTVKRKA